MDPSGRHSTGLPNKLAASEASIGDLSIGASTTQSTANLFASRSEKPTSLSRQHQQPDKSEKLNHPDTDYLCGVFSYRPDWLQVFASPRWYFLSYSLMGIITGAYKSYLIGTLSTIERRFRMSNSTSAIILIADNISPIFINFLVGYYANRLSRPKLMSIGTLIVCVGCIFSLLPFLIYGPAVHAREGATAPGAKLLCGANNGAAGGGSGVPLGVDENRCKNSFVASSWIPFLLLFFANFLNGTGGSVYFVVGSSYMDDNIRKKNSPFYFSLASSLRLLGPVLGYLTSSLCLRFNEDIFNEAANRLSYRDPHWIGAWWLGYVFFTICLLLVALPMMLFPRVLPMAKNQEANRTRHLAVAKASTVKDMWASAKRLLSNPIFVCKTLGFIFLIIASAGYGTNFPKYMEHQFGQSPSRASFLSGITKVTTSAVGILASGVVMQLLRPSPRSVAVYVSTMDALYLLGITALTFIGCHSPRIEGLHFDNTNTPGATPLTAYTSLGLSATAAAAAAAAAANGRKSWSGFETSGGRGSEEGVTSYHDDYAARLRRNMTRDFVEHLASLENACNADCGCSTRDFAPVCTADGRTLFSPCYAGCRELAATGSSVASNARSSRGLTSYSRCSCAGPLPLEAAGLPLDIANLSPPVEESVVSGICGRTCSSFVLYITIITVLQLIGSTTRIGSLLLYLRAVDPTDKSFALGAGGSLINLFAFIPYPLIYGSVLDSSCVLWDVACDGSRGSCKLYDIDKMRYAMHITTVAFLFIGASLYATVIFFVGRITNFYSDAEGDVTPDDSKNPNKLSPEKPISDDAPVLSNNGTSNGRTLSTGNLKGEVNPNCADSGL